MTITGDGDDKDAGSVSIPRYENAYAFNWDEMYGVDISAATISAVTEKVWPLVKAWQSRPLEAVYPLIFLDCICVNLRRVRIGSKLPKKIVLKIPR
ncbi:MAG: transposase [Anaerolineae bacterium]|nr:transposase [Anaerolineae bacterium]